MKKLFSFNRREMQEYIENFNYIDVKYSPLLNECADDIKPFLKKAFCEYEASKPHTIYNKINYAKFKDKINLIYRDEHVAQNMVSCFDFAISDLIDRFLNISTLNKLFNDHFIEFEWLQHVELNFDRIDLKFYRDHFIHQIRNCYMILKLLDSSDGKTDVNLMKKIQQVLKSKNSELAKYACVCVGEYEKYIKRYIDEIFSEECKSGRLADYIKNENFSTSEEAICAQMHKNAKDFAWEYFIRGSLVIASLFHDIGYPIQYIKTCSDILNDFISSIVRQDNFNFERLNDVLGSSLLFTIVDKEELRRSFNKPEHGALSAFALLLHFYETGTIHSLNPIKKAMVEFAALMIFDHTIDYTKNPTKTKPSFAKNPLSYALRLVDDLQEWDRVYFEIRQNSDLRYCEKCKMPIGRLWNKKIEHEILDKINTTIKEKKGDADQDYNRFIDSKEDEKLNMMFPDSQMKRVYVCGCNFKNKKIDFTNLIKDIMDFSSGMYENGSLFPYTKLNYTIISDNVSVIKENSIELINTSTGDNKGENIEQKVSSKVFIENNNAEFNFDNKLKLIFYLDYDPFRELYLLMINPKALDYRMGELNTLNKQFDFQRDVDFSMKTFMTNNPIMLKLRILIHFLYEIGAYKIDQKNFNPKYKNIIEVVSDEDFESIICFINRLHKKAHLLVYDYSYEYDKINVVNRDNSDLKESLSKLMCEIVKVIMSGKIGSNYKKNLGNTINCYLGLAFAAIEEKNESKKELKKIFNIKDFGNEKLKYTTEFLLKDVLKQFSCLRKDADLNNYYSSIDETDYGKVLKESISLFMEDDNYDPSIINEEHINNIKRFTYIDLKSDLYLFKEMYRFTRDSYNRRQISKKRTEDEKNKDQVTKPNKNNCG